MSQKFIRTALAAVGIAAVLSVAMLSAAQSTDVPVRFSASAFDTNRGRAGMVDLVINRWSSEGERDRLLTVLLDKGPDKLLDVLQDMPRVGYLQRPGSLSYDLHYARSAPLPDGGERIVLATDRRIGFREQVNQPRSIDYPFTVIELRLDRNGEGEGKMSLATKITADKDNRLVVLENYDLQPVMLTNIRRERVKTGSK
jgi:hypothetical protein